MSLPGTPPYGNPQGPSGGGSGTQSRQRVVEGAVFLEPDLKAIPLPPVDGFSVAVALGTPAPVNSPAAAPTSNNAARGRTVAGRTLHGAAPATAAAAAPSSSPSPSPSPDVAPAGASPVPTGRAAAAHPSASPGHGPKIETKTTIYPDDAPAAPSPQPTGDVQTYAVRKAIVRGYLNSATPINLYGLGAISFTIPSEEQKDGRGFTIAVFESGRHRHTSLIAFDADAKVAGGVVSVGDTQPLILKKNTGYLVMLYGDELAATPAPVVSGYPTPGNNPFPAPSGNFAPGYPQNQQPGQPVGPYGTPNPYGTVTPYVPPHP